MITVRELNRPSPEECSNCNRDSTEHYVVMSDEFAINPACTYCLDNVIHTQTSGYFTIESLETYAEMKDKVYDVDAGIEPLTSEAIQQLIEDTFISDIGVVDVDNDVFDDITICSEGFDEVIDGLRERDVVRVFEMEESDDEEASTDSKTVVEPSLKRQGELMSELDLVTKWRMQSTPAVIDSMIDEQVERVTDNTGFRESDLL